MKELFTAKRFSDENLTLLAKILEVLENYSAQGYDLSLRQLYYQLVAANVVSNSERSYKGIGNLVSDARLAGLIDWDMIKDRGRAMTENNHWRCPREILEASAAQFQIDKWATQPSYIEVMVEKQALEGVLEPVCQALDVPFTANKGYSSSSALYEAGKRIAERQDKEVHVIYLGDHDPSGIDMTRDVIERLRLFSSHESLFMHRVALNMPQVEELNPPENPAKLTDSRANSYIAKYGPSSWELDAIEPKALAKLVQNAVLELRDEDAWSEALAEENKMKLELVTFAKKSKFNND